MNGEKLRKQNETSVGYPLLIEIPSAKPRKINWIGKVVLLRAVLLQTGKAYKKRRRIKCRFQSLTMEELYDPQNVFLRKLMPTSIPKVCGSGCHCSLERTAFARSAARWFVLVVAKEIQVEEESKDAVAAFSKVCLHIADRSAWMVCRYRLPLF